MPTSDMVGLVKEKIKGLNDLESCHNGLSGRKAKAGERSEGRRWMVRLSLQKK